MKRRDFLSAASSMMLPVLVGGHNVKALGSHSALVQSLMQTSAFNTDRILVIINLNGGNDGLNTVIPKDQYDDEYLALRGQLGRIIAIPKSEILALEKNDSVGLHPSMTAMQTLFKENKLTIINSVSYENPSFSHFRSSQIWMTGTESNVSGDTGWAGRFLSAESAAGYAQAVTDGHPLALQIGYNSSVILNGPGAPMGITMENPNQFYRLTNGMTSDVDDDLPCTCEASELIKYIRLQKISSGRYADKIQAAFGSDSNGTSVDYSKSGLLGEKLKVIARLIRGGLQTKIYFVELGGFDTHNVQVIEGATKTGGHANLLKELSESIFAFETDLATGNPANAERVLGMTYSDFGRRATANSGLGTDHGIAAPMFLFGSGAKKRMIGERPVLQDGKDLVAVPGVANTFNIKMQIDFRRVYKDILTGWFGESSTNANSVLPPTSTSPLPTLSLFSDEIETINTGHWEDRTTWSCGRPPLPSEKVKINKTHTVTLTKDVSIKELRLNGVLNKPGKINITMK